MPKPIVTASAKSNADLPQTQDPSIHLSMLDLPDNDGDKSVSSLISPCETSRDITENHPRAGDAAKQTSSTPCVFPTLPVLPPILPKTDHVSTVSASGFSSLLKDDTSVATTHDETDNDVAKTQYFSDRMKF